MESILSEGSFLLFPYGGSRINKKKERPSKPFTVSEFMTTILTDHTLKEGYRKLTPILKKKYPDSVKRPQVVLMCASGEPTHHTCGRALKSPGDAMRC